MKKVLVLAAFFFAVLSSVQARIWRVNNNIGVTADFTTLQAAHDGAAAGDSIYLEGSANSYGNLNCSKKLYIVGPGYFLDQVPNTQALNYSAIVGGFNLYNGSAGTVIQGLSFRGSTINVYANDIIIRRNNFASSQGNEPIYWHGGIGLYSPNNNSNNGVSNIIISQNYGVIINVPYPTNSILITNNVIGMGAAYGENTQGDCINGGQSTILLIQNNIFRRGKVDVWGSTLTNNIMVNGFFEVRNNLFSNNLANKTQFASDNGNKANLDMTSVFNYTGSWDEWYKLKSGSPAIGAGYGSTSATPIDCGIYSGSSPYVVAGQVNMPAIYSFTNQPIGSNTDPIKVNVKVKAAGN